MAYQRIKVAAHIALAGDKDGEPAACQVRNETHGFVYGHTSSNQLHEGAARAQKVHHDQKRGHNIEKPTCHSAIVSDIINQAIASIDAGRRLTKGASTERLRLCAFKRDFPSLCKTSLAHVTEDMFEDWMEERLETVKPNTVLRELRLLRPLFAAAVRKYNLQRSPVQYLKPPRTIDERLRRILPDEMALLFVELRRARDPVAPIAAEFALEVGCRRGEQLRVEWRDYDADAGTIWLADAKNGRGRYLLLTARAQTLVESLPGRNEGGKLFKTTGNQLRKIFEYARARAAKRAVSTGRPDLVSVGTLRWHDFRHEAISRCFDDRWTSEEVLDFSGHVDIKSLLRYRHPKVDQSVARLRGMERNRAAQSTALKSRP